MFSRDMFYLLLCVFCFKGMEFHEELHNLGAKEGLKGRKLNKAIESFAWNITVLKVHEFPCCSFCCFSALLLWREVSSAKYSDSNCKA